MVKFGGIEYWYWLGGLVVIFVWCWCFGVVLLVVVVCVLFLLLVVWLFGLYCWFCGGMIGWVLKGCEWLGVNVNNK